MKVVFQRVRHASVVANGEPAGAIGAGALLLVGIFPQDTPALAAQMADKLAHLRVFSDAQDKMNLSVLDVGGGFLVVSNFTLCADCSHGRRPDFFGAARPEIAEPLYQELVRQLKAQGVAQVETGVFGADMQILSEADGPITILLDSADWPPPKG